MSDDSALNHREFLQATGKAATTLAAASIVAPAILAAPAPSKTIGVGCIGVETRGGVAAKDVPAQTQLTEQQFKLAERGVPYTSPGAGAWTQPGPRSGPFTTKLADGSMVTYSWYRFVDQPSFQQYAWPREKREALHAFVEQIHANWPIDRDYMAPPSRGTLVSLDPALIVMPPKGMEVGYVPIVTHQSAR